MPVTPDFHDGFFDGLKIDGQRVTVFLRTYDGRSFVGIADGVAAMKATGIKPGNIMFEAVVRSPEQITADSIDEVYDLPAVDISSKRDKYLQSAKQKHLSLLEIIPSYGATCFLLAESIRFESVE